MTKLKLIAAIFGDLLNTEKLSNIVNLSPTSSWHKGDTIPNRKLSLTRKETCWEYSYGFIPTLSFEEISNLFVRNFSTNIKELNEYISKNNLETKIYLVIEIINNEKPSLYFDRKFMELVLKMNGEIDVDMYFSS